MGRAFTIETARKIVEDEVGIPARLDEDDHKPEVEAATEDMLFAQLAFRLNSAAQWWGWKERLQTSATPRMRAESTVTRRPDEAFDEFLATLGSIFWQFWRRPPARSRESLRGALREDRSSASLQPCCTNWTTLDLMKQYATAIGRHDGLKAFRAWLDAMGE